MSVETREHDTVAAVEPAEDLGHEPACECMLCDLPAGQEHGPVEWKVTVLFPGPYPYPGVSDMLLCTHCKEDWLGDDWPEPYGNFRVIRCLRV